MLIGLPVGPLIPPRRAEHTTAPLGDRFPDWQCLQAADGKSRAAGDGDGRVLMRFTSATIEMRPGGQPSIDVGTPGNPVKFNVLPRGAYTEHRCQIPTAQSSVAKGMVSGAAQ